MEMETMETDLLSVDRRLSGRRYFSSLSACKGDALKIEVCASVDVVAKAKLQRWNKRKPCKNPK
jgi:hypothetical protein